MYLNNFWMLHFGEHTQAIENAAWKKREDVSPQMKVRDSIAISVHLTP